ncbi:MAG: 16S rRNA (guanine(527)-N(7))-methyltransferase RsmG [Alistipes senegalensis]|nr:16S rRNA (guanine(527)-N(7))-methyltransferase RsmG [Oxalobacter formigenes]MCM1280441.1 16S rRNA (guanine(527)-N(7))-methyltransferase RsmG [Alistipes senegalensis]
MRKKETAAIFLTASIDKAAGLLVEGVQKLPVNPEKAQIEKLLSYMRLLLRWNRVYNLTAVREAESAVVLHFLDSLAAAAAVKDCRRLLDVGSGAGFPGMVMAVLYPDMAVSLIDAVGKKTAFLSQVRAELQLENVTVHTGRVEAFFPAEKFDAVISRAFSDLAKFTALSNHLLADGGLFYAMKGAVPETEIEALPAGLKVKAVIPLDVPFLDAQRHLLVIEPLPVQI